MIYLSRFLRDAYYENAGGEAKRSIVAYAGLEPDVLALARRENHGLASRTPGKIVCVSAMAPHKGTDVLLRAFSDMRKTVQDASLDLIGPWPDATYEVAMRSLCSSLGLDDYVRFHGYMKRDDMLQACARARVFSLMSRCESFGIPGLEAQAMGTPVVCSNCCAMPEVCGRGGLYPAQADVSGTAKALGLLLSDDGEWRRYSMAAGKNAAQFTFERTARPIMEIFE
jgi:glycosyltransferase involved in cell wall biosynthesis